jgi:hypothetical protein
MLKQKEKAEWSWPFPSKKSWFIKRKPPNSQYLYIFLFFSSYYFRFLHIFYLEKISSSFSFFSSSSICVQYSSIENHSVCMSRCQIQITGFLLSLCHSHILFFSRTIHIVLDCCCHFLFPLDTCNNFFTEYTRTTHSFIFFLRRTVTELIIMCMC